jgi:hypothetical protein
MADLQQLKLLLPPDLIRYVHQEAARTDRTPSGMIALDRGTATPRATPAGGRVSIPDAPECCGHTEGIAEAKARLAKLGDEQQQLRRGRALKSRLTASLTAQKARELAWSVNDCR